MTTINNDAERGVLMISLPQHFHCDLGLPDNNDQTEDLRLSTTDLTSPSSDGEVGTRANNNPTDTAVAAALGMKCDLRRTHCATTEFSTTARVEMARAQVAQLSKAVNDGGPRWPRVLREWTRRVEAQPQCGRPESRPFSLEFSEILYMHLSLPVTEKRERGAIPAPALRD